MAGLCCFYNTENWTSFSITHNEEKGRILDLMTAENGKYSQPLAGAEIVVPDSAKEVYLKVEVRVEDYFYYYSFDGSTWNKIPFKLDSYKLSDDFISGGGFFTGAFVGMFCTDVSGRRKHADFDYFTYKELD
jgi:xylan 1,4-beta-xylosidase